MPQSSIRKSLWPVSMWPSRRRNREISTKLSTCSGRSRLSFRNSHRDITVWATLSCAQARLMKQSPPFNALLLWRRRNGGDTPVWVKSSCARVIMRKPRKYWKSPSRLTLVRRPPITCLGKLIGGWVGWKMPDWNWPSVSTRRAILWKMTGRSQRRST